MGYPFRARPLAVALFALVVTGCGGGGGTDNPTTITAPPVPVLTTVSVSLPSATIQVGQTVTASASGLDQNGAAIGIGTVTWATGSPTIATVSGAGVVTAVAPGQVSITATVNGRTGAASLTVIPVPVATVSLTPATVSLVLGVTQQLSVAILDGGGNALSGRAVTWATSNPAVGTVSSTGVVTGVAVGTTTVTAGVLATATNDGVLRSTASVTVAATGTLRIGTTERLDALVSTGIIDFATGRLNLGLANTNTTLAGTITGTGGTLNKDGTGSLTVTGANSFAGDTILTAGVLRAGSNTAFGVSVLNLNAGRFTSDGSTARTLGNALVLGGGVVLGDTSTYTGALTFSNTFSLGGGVRGITTDSTVNFTGVVSNGGFIKTGPGDVTLTGNNTYSLGTTLSQGTLRAGSNTAFGTGTVTLNAGRVSANSAVARSLANNLVLGADMLLGSTTDTGALTFSGNVDLGAATRTLTIDSAVTIGGIISNGGLTKLGAATLTLTGANSYEGATLISTGVLATVGNGVLRNNSSGYTIAPGATLSVGGLETLDTLTNNGTLLLNGGTVTTGTGNADTSLTGAVTGTGFLVKNGTGALVVTGANSYSGGTTLNTGTLRVTTNTSLGTSPLTLNGGTFTTAAAVNRSLTNTVLFGGDIVFGAASTYTGTLTFSGTTDLGNAVRTLTTNVDTTISGDIDPSSMTRLSGGLIKLGSANLTLSGNNAFKGATTVSAGGLITVGNSRLTNSYSVTVASGATLTVGGNETLNRIFNSGTIVNNGVITSGLATATSLDSVVSGSGAFIKEGAGTLTLNASTTYAAGTTINAGTLLLGAADRLLDAGLLTIDTGGTFDLGGFSETVGAVTLTNGTIANGTLTGTGYAVRAGTVSGILAGTGIAVTKTTSGTVTFSGSNTYSGATTVSAGTLATTGDERIADVSAVSVSLGATLQLGGVETIQTITSAGIITLPNAGSNLVAGSGANYTLGGTISGNGTFTKVGAGNITFSATGVYSYLGGTTVNAGALVYAASNHLVNTAPVTVNGGELRLTAFSDTVGAVKLTGGAITGTTGVLTATAYDLQAGIISANLAGAGAIATKSTAGIVTLSGDNTFTGKFILNAGTIYAGSDTAFGTGQICINDPTIASDSTAARTFANDVLINGELFLGDLVNTGALTFNGPVDLGAAAWTITTYSPATFNGILSNGGFIKDGASSLTLGAINTYLGGTTLNAGTLVAGSATYAFGGAGGTAGLLTINGGSLDASVAATFLPQMAAALAAKNTEIRACAQSLPLMPGAKAATEQDFRTEHLGLILNVKVVAGLTEAVAHVEDYGSHHSDAIITADESAARAFLAQIDSACVYWNASTRFTDGGEFGFGAEVGISTDRLHARGPMGIRELTTWKFEIVGQGQVRG